MSLAAQKERIRKNLGLFAASGPAAPGWPGAPVLAPQERAGWASKLLAAPPIRSFLRAFPFEQEAVEVDIAGLVRDASESMGAVLADLGAEAELLEELRRQTPARFVRQWIRNGPIRAALKRRDDKSDIDLAAYDREIAALPPDPGDGDPDAPDPRETLQERVARDWARFLVQERAERIAAAMEDLHPHLLERIEGKVRGYREVVEMTTGFRRFLGPAWGLSSTLLHTSMFDIWEQFAALYEQRSMIRQIARRLGRLQETERKLLEKRLASADALVWPLKRAEKASFVGIRESDDLSSIIPSEAALLAEPETAPLFYLKFAEKKLLTYDYEAREESNVRQDPPRERRKVLRRGPLVLAIDTSGSMAGDREHSAKALTLALARIALRQRRAVHLISFSSGTTELTLEPPRVSLSRLVQFLMLSFHGGTEIPLALDRGLVMFKNEGFHRADLVFVTDAQAPPLDQRRVAKMDQARARGHRFYGLVVGRHDEHRLLKQLDLCWRYDDSRLEEVVADLERYRLDHAGRGRSTTTLTAEKRK